MDVTVAGDEAQGVEIEGEMVMKRMKRFTVIGILAAIIGFMSLSFYQDVQAMPSFARRYQTSCVTCHTSFPQLSAVGDSFRINGYRFRDDERYLKEEPLELGDEAYKKLWPKAMWPSHIPQTSGFSVATRLFCEINTGNDNPERESDLTFVMPHELEASWAGQLGDLGAAYGDMIFMQEDYGTAETHSWLWAKAWIELSDLVGPENMFNLRVGTQGMHTMGLYTSTNEKRLGIQPYRINSWMMPWPEVYQSEGLVDFWGNTYNMQPQPGIELSGFGKSWLYYVGVVNGNIQKPVGGRPELFELEGVQFFGQSANTDTKDFYGGLAYKFGGVGYDGTGVEEDDVLARNAEYWRDDSVTLAVFGYKGTAKIMTDVYDDATYTTHTRIESDDDFWRFAIGGELKYKDLTVDLGWMMANDENPYGTLWDNSVEIDGWLAEVSYFVYPWLIPYIRYEGLHFHNMPETSRTDSIRIQHRQDEEVVTIGFKAHIRTNVHVTAEYQYFTYAPGFDCMTDQMTFVQLMMGF